MSAATAISGIRLSSVSQSYITTGGSPPISSSWRQATWVTNSDLFSSLTRGWVCRLQLLLSSPAQSFSGLSPVQLATIFYSLKFDTSLLVASYDSQVYGGGIRPRHHTDLIPKTELFVKTTLHELNRKHYFQKCLLMCVYRTVGYKRVLLLLRAGICLPILTPESG
jgi:hypothetical protein